MRWESAGKIRQDECTREELEVQVSRATPLPRRDTSLTRQLDVQSAAATSIQSNARGRASRKAAAAKAKAAKAALLKGE